MRPASLGVAAVPEQVPRVAVAAALDAPVGVPPAAPAGAVSLGLVVPLARLVVPPPGARPRSQARPEGLRPDGPRQGRRRRERRVRAPLDGAAGEQGSE